jgi:hypothetical protein
MNKSAEYLSKAELYWEKAEQATAWERQCWVMIASGYLRLHEEMRRLRSAEPKRAEVQDVAMPPRNRPQPQAPPPTVDFCQFSVVDRQLGSAAQPAAEPQPSQQGLRHNFPLLRRF